MLHAYLLSALLDFRDLECDLERECLGDLDLCPLVSREELWFFPDCALDLTGDGDLALTSNFFSTGLERPFV